MATFIIRFFPALVKPWRMKTARGAQNERKARHAGGARKRKGAVHIWVAIVAVSLVTLLFAWALCRAAAQADRRMAETFLRRQEEALGGAAEEDARAEGPRES